MKVFELREKSRQELTDLLDHLHKEKFNLLLRRSAQELPNPLRMRTLRRDIARVETVLREDELGMRKLLEPKKTPVKGEAKDKKQKAKRKRHKEKVISKNAQGK
ncbi:hypothetical protein AMJ87_06580 [candidate division WOR_3 bacterium SM23_60]|uniref:Large ribosomal subunit protein uL29 n=1 Tax=candidate division WOR_3 bacterium SM23_60 TaxID=1703780 RepID=A0A0S8GFY6_UNCW3|nr:MAG: hypothetical protein AMJ87_06580 [candidate division WOR_3 bacterium SM23_60]